jgi:outer membrane receptor protein involved in Fe transport
VLLAAALAAAPPIDEIVVTARRIPEPLASVPIAVTVLDPADLQRRGAVTLDDAARFVPGVSFNTAAGRGPNSNRPAIRGLTTIRNGIANATVAATFIDGTFLGGSPQSLRLYDLERIEVLRGPQSAQFGRATYGGAFNFVTRDPGPVAAGGVDLTVAEHATRRASGWYSLPLAGDRLGLVVAAGIDEYAGEYRNTRDGSLAGQEQSRDVSVKLRAAPTPALTASLRLAHQSTDDGHFAMWLQPRAANNCCFRGPAAPRAREYYVGTAQRSRTVTLATDLLAAAGGAGFRLDRDSGVLRVAWRPRDDQLVQLLTGVASDDLERGFDASYAAYDPVPSQPGSFLQRDELAQSDLSQELRWSLPLSDRLRLTTGVYAYRGRLDEQVENRVLPAPGGGVVVLPNFGDRTLQDIGNRAVFAAAEVSLPRGLVAGAELRYARDDVTVTTVPNPGSSSVPQRFGADFASLVPRLTLVWQASDAFVPYLNVAQGRSPGTFNPVVPPAADGGPDERYRVVDEETVWNYELGARGSHVGAHYAVAAYRLDARDQQFTRIVELTDGRTATLLGNVGSTRVWGLELEGGLALAPGLSLDVTYAWTDAEIEAQLSEELADLRGGNGTAEALESLGDAAGQSVPRVPRHMVSAVLEVRRALAGGLTGFAGTQYTYESSRFAQEDNLIATGGRGLLGFTAGATRGALTVQAFVNNVTDDRTPLDVQRYLDRRSGALPACASFVAAGTAPPGTVCAGSSTTPRGFAVSLPRGRQIGVSASLRF